MALPIAHCATLLPSRSARVYSASKANSRALVRVRVTGNDRPASTQEGGTYFYQGKSYTPAEVCRESGWTVELLYLAVCAVWDSLCSGRPHSRADNWQSLLLWPTNTSARIAALVLQATNCSSFDLKTQIQSNRLQSRHCKLDVCPSAELMKFDGVVPER